MSSFKLSLVLVLLFALQACGFQPLYQQGSANMSAGSQFESILVRPIADRVGQELRNRLYDALTPAGQPADPLWELDVTLTESIQKIAVEQTSFSTRANLRLTATYSLNSLGGDSGSDDNRVTHSHSVSAISSYNILDSEYATLVAERDARSRAVQVLSADIRRQLAIWLNSQQP